MSKTKTAPKTTVDLASVPFRKVTAAIAKQIITTAEYVIVDFSAEWCGPCHRLRDRLIKELIPKLPPGTDIITIDVDDEGAYADEMKIKAMPTLFLYKNGKRLNVIVDGVEQEFICGGRPEIVDIILTAFNN